MGKFTIKVILFTILAAVVFYVLVFQAGFRVDYSFYAAGAIFLIMLLLTSDSLAARDKERQEQREYEQDIEREEYLREKGRMQAHEDERVRKQEERRRKRMANSLSPMMQMYKDSIPKKPRKQPKGKYKW